MGAGYRAGGSGWISKIMTGEWDSGGVKGTAWALSPLVPSPTRGLLSPLSMDGWVQEHAGGGQWKITGQMGYGLSRERTACPGEGQPRILELSGNLGIVCFSRIPMTRKVNVDVQGGAAHPCMAQSQASARAGLAGRRPGF